MNMKKILKTFGYTILLLAVYMALQGIFSIIPAIIYIVKGVKDGTVAIDEISSVTEMMGVNAGSEMVQGTVNALAWGLLLSSVAMLLFLHFCRFYRLKRSMLTSVPRRPLVVSVLLVFASMFALNILVQCFSLENILEVQFDALSHTFVGAITISVFAPLLEEVLFRGAIQGYMMRHFKPWTAIICSALVFGLIHMNPVQVVYATLLGVIFGWIYYRTGSLLPVILGHVLNNSVATISLLLGFEEGSDMPLDTTDKILTALVFVVATVVAVKLVQMLNRELPAVAKEEEL